MRDCEYFQELLCRLPDGDLSAEESAALLEHVDSYPDCARLYAAFSSMGGAIRSGQAEPPAELEDIVMDRIWAEHVKNAPQAAKKKPRFRPWFAQLAAACFVLAVAVGAITGIFGARNRAASGSAETADYLPQAQSDTVYARVPAEADPAENAAPPQSQSRSASFALPEADTGDEAAPEAASQPAPAQEQPVPAEPGSGVEDAAAAEDAAPEEVTAEDADVEDGIMTVMEPPALAEEVQIVTVYDPFGQIMGVITDTAGLQALLTGEPWQGETADAVCSVTLEDGTYRLAEDGSGALLWRRDGEEGFSRSPGTLADLKALIQPG